MARFVSLRTIALGGFFLALAGLEVTQGLRRWQALHRARGDELLAAADRGQSDLVRELAFQVSDEREHAHYIASLPSVIDLLQADGEAARARAERDLLACLVGFQDIDRLSLLDAADRERLRCERIGEGIGSLPAAMLAESLDAATASLLAELAPGATRTSSIVDDARRVEMPPSKRQVIHFASRVLRQGEPVGTVVMTVYAAPLLQALEAFAPLEGARTLLVDARGERLGTTQGVERESIAAAQPAAWQAFGAGATLWRGEDDWLIARPLDLDQTARVVTLLPRAARDRALAPLQKETRRILGTVLFVTLAIGVAAVFILRQSLAALEVRETERYLALVRRENAKWKALTESAADMIWIMDPESGRIREQNARSSELLAGRELSDCMASEEHERLRFALREARDRPLVPLALPDLRLSCRGVEHVLEPRLVGIELDGERVVEVAARDVTRERAMERQLAISERLSSLGLLTAGVAHEINNPLEGIGNYLALLGREGLEPERRERYLESLRLGFERIRDIVRDLLTFARPPVERGQADLANVVERARKLFGYGKRFDGVEFDTSGARGPALVAADPGRIEQVLLNLMLNAATAMDGRGRITIVLERSPRAGPDGPMVELCIEDEGPGIPEQDLGRIFDPFFTTTQGTGLGLSVSYGIVQAYGGRIRAENLPERGARFTIELPALAPRAPHASESRA